MNRRIIILGIFFCITFLLSGCISYIKPNASELKKIRNVSITIKGNPKLSHIGEIANESVWGTIVFGSIPNAIADTVRDKNVAKSINQGIISSDYQMQFINAISNNLEKQKALGKLDSFAVNQGSLDQYKASSDAVVSINIIDWGTRARKKGSEIIIPFMDYDITVTRNSDNQLLLNEKRTVTVNVRDTIEDYTKNQNLYENNFIKMINKAAADATRLFISNDFE